MSESASVQTPPPSNVPLPPPFWANVTSPVGVTAVPSSATVAVQVTIVPISASAGVQEIVEAVSQNERQTSPSTS